MQEQIAHKKLLCKQMKELPVNKIICGDCLSVMKDWPDGCVDLLLTDPPYGITSQKWDVVPDWDLFAGLIKSIGTTRCQYLLFGMQPTFSEMIVKLQKQLLYKDEIIWHYKDGGAGNTKGTGLKNVHQNLAWFSGKLDGFLLNIDQIRIAYQPNERNKYPVKRGKKIWRPNPLGAYPTNLVCCPKHKELKKGKTQFHKHYTIKPLRLIMYLILGFTKPNSLILDPFCGSGTTCVAAKMLGRRYIGVDISESSCRIARMSLKAVDTGVPVAEQKAGQKGLFEKG